MTGFVDAVTPVMSSPASLDADGFLKIQGYYPGSVKSLHFSVEYLAEHGIWKLANIDVETK